MRCTAVHGPISRRLHLGEIMSVATGWCGEGGAKGPGQTGEKRRGPRARTRAQDRRNGQLRSDTANLSPVYRNTPRTPRATCPNRAVPRLTIWEWFWWLLRFVATGVATLLFASARARALKSRTLTIYGSLRRAIALRDECAHVRVRLCVCLANERTNWARRLTNLAATAGGGASVATQTR